MFVSVIRWSTEGKVSQCDPECLSCTLASSHSWNDTTTSHAKLALHKNVKVAFSKLWNGWNRMTHGNSST
ncbi:hypothetical protein Hdeb2414_s0004g00140021 [Helianthus debilis subsp. tardiflorus]